MLMDIIYLVTFMVAFMGPAIIVGAIFEHIYYDVMGNDPNEDYYKD